MSPGEGSSINDNSIIYLSNKIWSFFYLLKHSDSRGERSLAFFYFDTDTNKGKGVT